MLRTTNTTHRDNGMPTLLDIITGWNTVNDAVFWPPSSQGTSSATVKDTDKAVIFNIDMPGFEPSDILIEHVSDEWRITAKREDRPSQSYAYTVADIDTASVSATLTNGVLTLTLPRTPRAIPQVIPVS